MVFDPTGRNTRVSACMRCGVVTATESLVVEPRPHDVQCIGNDPIAMEQATSDWLATWPRLAGVFGNHGDATFLSASLRAADENELEKLEAEEREAQRDEPARRRILDAGIPSGPVPGALPLALSHFSETWSALRLDETASLDELASHLSTAGRPWVLPQIAARPSLARECAERLASDEENRRAEAAVIVGELRLADGPILEAIERWIDRSEPVGSTDLHALLHAVWRLGTAGAPLAPALTRLAERVGDTDYYLHKRLVELARKAST